MKTKVITVGLVVLLALAVMSFIASSGKEKSAFVYNERLFSAFKGTIELQKRLNALEVQHKRSLDSLMTLPLTQSNMAIMEEEKIRVETVMEELSSKYTADLWKQINESVSDYGKENGYDFIFGASGDGSLMYAHTANDITPDVIQYINRKYEGHE